MEGRLYKSYWERKIKKRGQIGIEYMIIIGFVTFAVMSVLVFAFFFSDEIKDRIKLNQVESFAVNLINSAESVFFAGEPSKTTVKLYLPDGVEEILITTDALIITTRIRGGINKRAFDSKVPLNGTIIPGEGIRRISLEAKVDVVEIKQS